MATETKAQRAEKLAKLIEAATGMPLAWYASPEGKAAMDAIAKKAGKDPFPTPQSLTSDKEIPAWLGDVPVQLQPLAARQALLEKEYWEKDEEFWKQEDAALLILEINEGRKTLGWPNIDFFLNPQADVADQDQDDDEEEPTDAPGKAYDISLDNLSDSDFASALEMAPKAHPSIPLSNGKRNGVGLRYDHRYDDCAYLAARERSGTCTVNRTPCPCLGGGQKTCPMYNPFRDQKAGPRPNERNTLYPKA